MNDIRIVKCIGDVSVVEEKKTETMTLVCSMWYTFPPEKNTIYIFSTYSTDLEILI